jgi:hypothetical protein
MYLCQHGFDSLFLLCFTAVFFWLVRTYVRTSLLFQDDLFFVLLF